MRRWFAEAKEYVADGDGSWMSGAEEKKEVSRGRGRGGGGGGGGVCKQDTPVKKL